MNNHVIKYLALCKTVKVPMAFFISKENVELNTKVETTQTCLYSGNEFTLEALNSGHLRNAANLDVLVRLLHNGLSVQDGKVLMDGRIVYEDFSHVSLTARPVELLNGFPDLAQHIKIVSVYSDIFNNVTANGVDITPTGIVFSNETLNVVSESLGDESLEGNPIDFLEKQHGPMTKEQLAKLIDAYAHNYRFIMPEKLKLIESLIAAMSYLVLNQIHVTSDGFLKAGVRGLEWEFMLTA